MRFHPSRNVRSSCSLRRTSASRCCRCSHPAFSSLRAFSSLLSGGSPLSPAFDGDVLAPAPAALLAPDLDDARLVARDLAGVREREPGCAAPVWRERERNGASDTANYPTQRQLLRAGRERRARKVAHSERSSA